MNIVMIGVDFKTAEINFREKLSFSADAAQNCLKQIRQIQGVSGCVLLSTCNRTELYLSSDKDLQAEAISILCCHANLKVEACEKYFHILLGHDVIEHLMMVSSGLHSQVRGENQILEQVKTACVLARDAKCMDPFLEVIFRNAISAGKKSRSLVSLEAVDSSVAHQAVQMLEKHRGTLKGVTVMVLGGSGEIGRLLISLLMQKGCNITATYRFHRQKEINAQQGCRMVSFENLYTEIERCEVLFSATSSPHYVVDACHLAECQTPPVFMIDLAVPRDIDPAVQDLPGVVHCWNVDTLESQQSINYDLEKISAIKEIHEFYIERFYNWKQYRFQSKTTSS